MPMNGSRKIGSSGVKSRPIKQGNQIAATELRLFVDNDERLYRQMVEPIQKALVNRLANGTYDQVKAEKAFLNLVTEGASRYNVEFGSGKGVGGFDKPTRELAAKELAAEFRVEANFGNYDNRLNKKNAKATWPGKLEPN